MPSVKFRATIPALALCVLLAALPALAQEPGGGDETPVLSARDKQTLILTVENDKFLGGTDEEYTNGLKLTWVSPDLSRYADDPRLPEWSHALIAAYPFVNDPGKQHAVSLSLGHSIYTPKDVGTSNPPDDQRPYAGWLYFSVALHSKDAEQLDTFETTLGMVGPSALGEEVQNNFHNAIGAARSHGWSRQLHDEPGLLLTWQRNWRLLPDEYQGPGLGYDLIPHLGVTVGNVADYVNAGGELRFGWNLPSDFGTALIGPGSGVSAPVEDGRLRPASWWGTHVFLGVDGRAVARDIFLDGNTWEHSPHVSKEFFVADFLAGLAVTLGDVKITYTQAYRTREYEGQPGDGHVFGSLAVAVSF